jgi:hypothetical protein
MDPQPAAARSNSDPDEEKKVGHAGAFMEPAELRNADGSSMKSEDVLGLQDLDPAMNMKMHLINNVSNDVVTPRRAKFPPPSLVTRPMLTVMTFPREGR